MATVTVHRCAAAVDDHAALSVVNGPRTLKCAIFGHGRLSASAGSGLGIYTAEAGGRTQGENPENVSRPWRKISQPQGRWAYVGTMLRKGGRVRHRRGVFLDPLEQHLR